MIAAFKKMQIKAPLKMIVVLSALIVAPKAKKRPRIGHTKDPKENLLAPFIKKIRKRADAVKESLCYKIWPMSYQFLLKLFSTKICLRQLCMSASANLSFHVSLLKSNMNSISFC